MGSKHIYSQQCSNTFQTARRAGGYNRESFKAREVLNMAIDTFTGTWTDKDLLKRIDDLPKFRSLVIYGPGFTDEGAELLTRCTELRELHLLDSSLTDEGLRHIGKINSIDWLVLDNAAVSDRGLHHLGDLRRLNGLHVLSTVASDEGFSVLMNMPKLTYLEAAGNLHGKSLSMISQLPELTFLRLASAKADDNDFSQLGFARALRELSFDMPLVSRDAVEALQMQLQTNCLMRPFRFYKPEDRITYLSGYCLDLYEKQEFVLARTAADDVLRFFPFNPAAHGARAFINFHLGNYQDFRHDLQNARDNASLFGEDEVMRMAEYYLMLESTQTIRAAINDAQPHNFLAERLRATTRKKKEEPVASLIRRFEVSAHAAAAQADALRRAAANPLIKTPTAEEIAGLMQMQKDDYNEFVERLTNRLKREKEEGVPVPWSW